MTKTTLRQYLLFLAALAAGLATPSIAAAQPAKERQSVHLRNDCRLAAQTLNKGHPAPKTDWALQVIRDCDESAGPVLQLVWAAAPSDSAALEQLVQASAAVRDQRIFAAVDAAARNTAAAQIVRLSALRVLASYIDPHEVVELAHLRPRADSGAVAWKDHAYQLEGAQPLAATAATSVRALFSSLTVGDPDPVVRYAGRRLRARFP